MKYDNIIFDIGGVLLEFSEKELIEKYFDQCTPETYAKVYKSMFDSGLWQHMDRGDLDEEGMIDAVSSLLSSSSFNISVRNMIVNYFETMLPLPTNEFIPLLKLKGKKIYILSNAPLAFHKEIHRIPYVDLIDGIFLSSDYHLLKPQPEIYHKFLERFNLKAEKCFFIDDMQANIQGAADVGIAGYCLKDKNFKELGLILELD